MPDKLRAAAEAALEALEWVYGGAPVRRDGVAAIRALRAALAEQQDVEPVAWRLHPYDYGIGEKGFYVLTTRTEQVKAWGRKGWQAEPLYAQPPRREWVSMTEEEWTRLHKDWMDNETTDSYDLMNSVEAALKEKNHD